MAYGKKRGRSRSTRRKSSRKRRVQRGLSRVEKKEVHRIIAGETELKKFIDEHTLIPESLHGTTKPYVMDMFNPIVQGVDSDERIGDEITVKKCSLNLKFYIPRSPMATSVPRDIDSHDRMYRWFVCSKKNNVHYPTSSMDISGTGAFFPWQFFADFFRVGDVVYDISMTLPDMYREVNTEQYTVHSTGRFELGMSERSQHTNYYTNVDGAEGTVVDVLTSPFTTIQRTNPTAISDEEHLLHNRRTNVHFSEGRARPDTKTLNVSVPRAGLGKLKFQTPSSFDSPNKSNWVPNKRYFFLLVSCRSDGTAAVPNDVLGPVAYGQHKVNWTDS